MKKFLLSLLAIVGFVLPAMASSIGESFDDGIYRFQILDDDKLTAALLGTNGDVPSDLTLPSTATYYNWDGTPATLKVVKVSYWAFGGANIVKLTVPGTYELIDNNSFSSNGIREIVFESGENALVLNGSFSGGSSDLTTLTINRSLKGDPLKGVHGGIVNAWCSSVV